MSDVKSEDAERLARELVGSMGDRWKHTTAVARRAAAVNGALQEDDRDVLRAAAWLHDVGYAPSLAVSDFHPLDGARWLRSLGEERLARLVAYHSGAVHEAEVRGLGGELAEFHDEGSLISAALSYCDIRSGPQGQPMTPEQRLADVEARHGVESAVAVGLRAAWPELVESVATIERLLPSCSQPR